MKKRIVFTFDEKSLNILKSLANGGSLAGAIREALQVDFTLRSQARQGFNEIILRNPETREERRMIIPLVQEV